MGDRRVAITGLGVVSPVGSTLETFWDNITAGTSGIDIIKQLPDIEQYTSRIGGEVKDLDIEIDSQIEVS